MTYDNIKGHKKQGLILSLEDTFLKKSQGGVEFKIYRPAFSGLKEIIKKLNKDLALICQSFRANRLNFSTI